MSRTENPQPLLQQQWYTRFPALLHRHGLQANSQTCTPMYRLSDCHLKGEHMRHPPKARHQRIAAQ